VLLHGLPRMTKDIDIAIEEKRPDDVIRWYDKRKAASHLRKAQRVIKELDKEKEWQEYLSALRKANERNDDASKSWTVYRDAGS